MSKTNSYDILSNNYQDIELEVNKITVSGFLSIL